MHASKFYPGARVILHRNYTGAIGGTVISTRMGESPTHHWNTNPVLLLHVIFDDGTKLTAGSNNFWLEHEYDPRIPF